MARQVNIIVLLACCWVLAPSYGRAAAIAPGSMEEWFTPLSDIEVYEDRSGSESIETVQSKEFRRSLRAIPSFGQTRSVYWFRLSLKNASPEPGIFYLRIENQWLDLIDFFVRSEGEIGFERYRSGARVAFKDEVPGIRGPALQLRFAAEETKTVFVRVQSNTAVRVPILFLSEEAYRRGRPDISFLEGLFYGILGFLIIYNLFAWSILKQRAYIYYILLLVFLCFFQLAWDDLIPRLSPFTSPETVLHLCTSAFALVRICNILFISSFMDARRKYPLIYRLLDFLLMIAVALAVLYFVDFYVGNYLMKMFVPILACILTSILAFMWYRGETHARYLFMAHLPFPLVGVVVVASLEGVLPFHPLLHQLPKAAYLWQAVFYSLSLADKFAVMQQGFRGMLEHTVAERSAELMSANRELQREIHERKRTEDELRVAKEAAESGVRAKTRFLANMSHEIRTPLGGVIGMAELALNTQLTDEQREYVESVRTSADALLNLINDILDFSKIEAGKLHLQKLDFGLRNAIAEAMAMVATQAQAKSLELVYRIRPNIPDAVVGDPGRLRQILVNLVANAVKFTDKGEVAVFVEMKSRIAKEVRLHFCVADTGIGIPEGKIESIFDAFEQADGSTSRKYGGTGLGLSISLELVHRMGGSIWVESTVRRGAKFHFEVELGLQGADSDVSGDDHIAELKGLRILVVDDNETNREMLREILEYWGMRPTIVAGGAAAAVVAAAADKEGRPLSLVLAAGTMPEMDGFELARRLTGLSTGEVHVIMMLSSVYERTDTPCGSDTGIAAYLPKPINQAELLHTLRNVLMDSSVPSARPQDIPRFSIPRTRRGLHILLAEDNAVNKKLAVRILEKMGHTVVVAGNGREAVEFWESQAFHLILMDVQMPEMDGFEAVRIIRERERSGSRHIPVVAMTAHALKGDKDRCRQAGMDDYISKPIDTRKLFESIERIADRLER
ncbi:MAG: response regulator [Pseudomonadota bacterium]